MGSNHVSTHYSGVNDNKQKVRRLVSIIKVQSANLLWMDCYVNASAELIFDILVLTSSFPTRKHRAKLSRDCGSDAHYFPQGTETQGPQVDAGVDMGLINCCICRSWCDRTHDTVAGECSCYSIALQQQGWKSIAICYIGAEVVLSYVPHLDHRLCLLVISGQLWCIIQCNQHCLVSLSTMSSPLLLGLWLIKDFSPRSGIRCRTLWFSLDYFLPLFLCSHPAGTLAFVVCALETSTVCSGCLWSQYRSAAAVLYCLPGHF